MIQIDTDKKYKTTDHTDHTDFLYKNETFALNGCFFDVNKKLGTGFLEPVYQAGLEKELKKRNIPYIREKTIKIYYDAEPLDLFYKADFVCFDNIIVEIKAVSKLTNEHRAQVLNYLKATGYRVALLVNFGSYPKAEIERIVR